MEVGSGASSYSSPLALQHEVLHQFTSNLFCLAKPDGELRQIMDRRPRNGAEHPPPPSAPKMGHASSFIPIVVPKEGCVRGSLDDLRNFYHEFVVPVERALSTPVGPAWVVRDFRVAQALQALEAQRPEVNLRANTAIFACFAGLSMGDHWAPLIAQMSHERVLGHFKESTPSSRALEARFPIAYKLCLQVFDRYVPKHLGDGGHRQNLWASTRLKPVR